MLSMLTNYNWRLFVGAPLCSGFMLAKEIGLLVLVQGKPSPSSDLVMKSATMSLVDLRSSVKCLRFHDSSQQCNVFLDVTKLSYGIFEMMITREILLRYKRIVYTMCND